MRNIDMNEAGDQSARETAERDRMFKNTATTAPETRAGEKNIVATAQV